MLIAYPTTDEVNRDLATRMAADWDITLALVSPREPLPDGRFDAVIYDLDYVPAALRNQIVKRLISSPSQFPVAVHGYNLVESEIESLYLNGVPVYRRLDRAVFLSLIVAWRLGQLRAGQADNDLQRNALSMQLF